ncbi:hypothetical protein ASA1KI_40330 [Opitutales bacterium ASA1]|uniref:hypothetical protein n=1 Tax=Congregicoccus parvus TaxID=3081749 RepID=UPI002B2C98BE|nr:hypothetical protein ASA1KI_40330 [Opitutales bacterium ASA1]
MRKKSLFNIFVFAAIVLVTHFMLRPERGGRSEGFEQRKADLQMAADRIFGKADAAEMASSQFEGAKGADVSFSGPTNAR